MNKRSRRYFIVVCAAVLAGAVFFVLFYSRMNRLVIITDPVWKRLALERGDYGSIGLRYTFLKSGFLLEVQEIEQEGFDPESVYNELDGKEGDVLVLSPGLSQFAAELGKWISDKNPEESLPDPDIIQKKIIAFSPACRGKNAGEGEGGIICISEDLSGAVKNAGSKAAEYVDTPGGKAQLFLVITESSPRIDRYAEAFFEGWQERRTGDNVRRIELNSRDESGEILREEGVGSGDFVWVGGLRETEAVLGRLDEWGVPSCVTGSNAAAAYPDTIKIEIRYGWEKALLAAASAAASSERAENGTGDRQINLEGVLRSY